MRARSVWALTLGAVAFIVAVSAGGQAGPSAAPDTADLRQQIAALERRVGVLEERLRRQPAAGSLVTPPTSLQTPALPKGWQQRDFNGMPYYLAPVQEGLTRATEPAR